LIEAAQPPYWRSIEIHSAEEAYRDMNSANQHEPFDLMKMDRKIDSRTKSRRIAKLAVWGGVAAIGLKRGGVVGLFAAAYALTRVAQVLSGERPLLDRLRPRQVGAGAEGAMDGVDEASWESFPASDPPAARPG
jgi:hypothetical protein